MDDRMIVFAHDGLTFMYRVGGIAIHDGRVLVEQAVGQGFCFLPGGRVEFGESAVEALRREAIEELGEPATVGRLLIVADSFFELDGRRYQEVNLYFQIDLDEDSPTRGRGGRFEGAESSIVLEWIPVDALEQANLKPTFLPEHIRTLPSAPLYMIRDEREVPPT
ncbi:MAG: NUDIX domain-containing protein [Spirochaetaceae bacterium]|nr:NUDIX domain-containing protein [Spirochaetaceae bacterium]